jgi:thiamine-phosphate pyrophosphorylase
LKISRTYILRTIDANINRLQEALRVCEDIARFILSDISLASQCKRMRHRVKSLVKRLPQELIKTRDIQGDIGKDTKDEELRRADVKEIFVANLQRAKEASRVLEEFTKLLETEVAVGFKTLRYQLYHLEKKTAGIISTLRNLRP